MPITRKPLLRAEILDQLLAHGKWTGNELLKRLNEKLQDLDEKTIDSRTFKRDLDFLEYEKNAPLHRPERGNMAYYYAERFSLKDIPLDSDELASLKEAIAILSKVENFQMIGDLDLIIGKLENRIHTNLPANQSVVQFEDHTHARGIHWFSELFDAIKEQTALHINYQSFKSPEPKDYVIHPYLLKEYRNRWWLLGRCGTDNRIMTLGLDRINAVRVSKEAFMVNDLFDPDTYFENAIGVSIDYEARPEKILLKIKAPSVPHVESKPVHKNQKIVRRDMDGSIIIQLDLIINYELKSTILAFGENLEVLEPVSLRVKLSECLDKAARLYKSDIK
jgi:predicted DNA-binding transcriptional regulator YafY